MPEETAPEEYRDKIREAAKEATSFFAVASSYPKCYNMASEEGTVVNCDFLMERKLDKEAPELAGIYRANVLCCQNMLLRYRSFFPTFTDHSALHSMEVIAFANQIVAENIERMNADEIFVFLMAAYLHDAGMGISEKDYQLMKRKVPGLEDYAKAHPGVPVPGLIRKFHNEFSGLYIEKYQGIFDFPSKEYLFGVIQASRGHRQADLFDEAAYPADLALPDGNTLCLPYLASLIRLADELDIAADRNLLFMYDPKLSYDEKDVREFARHKAIRFLDIEEDRFVMRVDGSDPEILEGLKEVREKVGATLDYCRDVVAKRSSYVIRQKRVDLEVMENAG